MNIWRIHSYTRCGGSYVLVPGGCSKQTT